VTGWLAGKALIVRRNSLSGSHWITKRLAQRSFGTWIVCPCVRTQHTYTFRPH